MKTTTRLLVQAKGKKKKGGDIDANVETKISVFFVVVFFVPGGPRSLPLAWISLLTRR